MSRQENSAFPWLFGLSRQEKFPLGCLAEPTRKWCVFLAVSVSCEENSVFPWLLRLAAKKMVHPCFFNNKLLSKFLYIQTGQANCLLCWGYSKLPSKLQYDQ